MENLKNTKQGVVTKITKRISAATLSLFAMMMVLAHSAFAANADLDTMTTTLTDGIGDMKTNALTIITLCIAVFVVIFGIGWLIGIVRKKMQKAS